MIWLGLTFIILLAIGMPIALTVGISALVFFVIENVPVQIVVQKMVSSTQSFSLLAVPFFVLAGNLMNETGITSRLIKFATLVTGHMRGGLAQVSVVLSCLMGGISGSATADAAMESRILGPDMEKRGYSKGFTAAILAMGGLITSTIPPSLGLILYGVTGEVSIGRLFMGGIIPGFLMTVALMFAVAKISKKRSYVKEHEHFPTIKEVLKGLLDNIWALIFPVILIVGIRFGVFTPSEAGAFAVVYAIFVGVFVYKELTFKVMVECLKQTAVDLAVIMFIIICSNAFGYAIVTGRLPQTLANLIIQTSNNKYIVLTIIMIFVFIVGMFMEATANVLLLTPIFLPIITQYGIDPVHFGVMYMILITMGGMTPPIGVTMYTTCSILECPVEKYTKESIPFVGAIVVLLVILAVFPQLVLFLPNLIYGA
ncbi:TRAP transporter large permease [Candidatus Galacturonibacter soehngenii]|uniref:TRAP transporter large permease n=1 Tax=Candidatus Galacturonatibacter soehngenii TaxID=2307010 RepID=A0A7V7QIL3_9FIRM|nr:TRAP transporter large permease [Candidatus Galacturonibacter soehngenii]KAB1436065.1 TRAP transporter large permease [Candidatus Galacturonibacter soehngenii]MBA4686196.1 TRAP transporter large permease [Candidatus Galacturonibacter soehngenii]